MLILKVSMPPTCGPTFYHYLEVVKKKKIEKFYSFHKSEQCLNNSFSDFGFCSVSCFIYLTLYVRTRVRNHTIKDSA